ncbi:MAG: hypothetical protein ACKN9K_16090, partial [Dolichospermum sp.]
LYKFYQQICDSYGVFFLSLLYSSFSDKLQPRPRPRQKHEKLSLSDHRFLVTLQQRIFLNPQLISVRF